MAKFNYTAVNKRDKSIKGTIEASSLNAANKTLINQGYKPIIIREQKTGFDPNNIKLPKIGGGRVKGKDLVIFTRQLSTMINAGVPLVRSLATLQAQTKNQHFRTVLSEISKDVESGQSLAESLEKHPKVFSPIYTNMVKAGEAGGILDDILKRLAIQQEKDAAIRSKVKSASIYPMILLVITIGAFFILTIFIIPKIGAIITDVGNGAELPIYTKAMLGFSQFLQKFWYIAIGGMVGGVVAFKRYIKTTKGRHQWHFALLKIPILKNIVTKMAVARFSRIFASLMSSGVAVLDALSVTGGAIGNVVIEEELKAAAREVTNGKQLSQPLSESAVFPPIVSQMLAIGEETGQIDTILIKVAEFYEEEVDALIDGLSATIEPLMILVLGGMVGLIAASVMGPISSLTQNI